ncbi:MAG: iron-siderophore ABC transporter substrate-binding protein [Mycetocola sp.]
MIIEHEFGSTTIEAEPTRVVTLGVTDADPAIALGVVPVGNAGYSYYKSGLGPWTDELIGDSELTLIGSDSEPNLEQIIALDPDLILGVSAGFDDNLYTQLSAIAPTVARPAGDAAYTTPRSEQTEIIATALGKAEEDAALAEKTEKLLADTAAAHPEFEGKTGTVVLPFSAQYGAFLPGDARGQFLTALGFTAPQSILDEDTGDSFFVTVSPERASMLDGDLLVVIGDDETGDIEAGTGPFAGLHVTTNDAIIVADQDQRGAITYNSVLSAPFAVDSLVPDIAEALS